MGVTSERRDVVAQVVELRNNCPVHSLGDTVYMAGTPNGGWVIDFTRSSVTSLCMWYVAPMSSEVVKVRHGVADEIHVQCIDPGPPYSDNGVVWQLRPAAEEP